MAGFDTDRSRLIRSTRVEPLACRAHSDIIEDPLILSTARIYSGRRNNMDKFEVRFYKRDGQKRVRTAAYQFEAMPEVLI